jgi:hypothetical protein
LGVDLDAFQQVLFVGIFFIKFSEKYRKAGPLQGNLLEKLQTNNTEKDHSIHESKLVFSSIQPKLAI